MGLDEGMALINRLLTSADALAALTARLRLAELGEEGDPGVRRQLDRVAEALDARELFDTLEENERSVLLAFARTYLKQALDLVDDPARNAGWAHTDPVLLQAQGSASAAVAHLFARAGLGAPDARILDIGTGVAGLAIAFCSTFPQSTVVGVDPWEPALAIAERNVEEAGLGSLDAAVDDLRTVRSGGSVVTAEDAASRLERAGFRDVREAELGMEIPLGLVVGSRAAGT